MGEAARTVVSGTWVLAREGDRSVLRRDAHVVVEGRRIAAVTTGAPPAGDVRIGGARTLVLPGFVNLHSHCVNGPLFRGVVDDAGASDGASGGIYSVLMPVGDLAARELSREAYGDLVALGMLEALKGGSTTLLDMWRPEQDVFFDVARRLGVRAYAAPYLFSTRTLSLGPDGRPLYRASDEAGDGGLERVLEMHRRFDGDADGRIRVVLGPHGTDSCGPDLLRAVRAAADRLGCRVTIHLAQSDLEEREIRARYGKSPVEYLRDVGLLGPDLVAAHCVYASDADLDILRDTGTHVASCARVYARGGTMAAYHRFAARGIGTGLGTDSPSMDLLGEMRAAGFVSKLSQRASDVATAQALLEAATVAGARALGRADLGRIAAGARADLLVVDLGRPGLVSADDPLRTLVWYATPSDISTVIVDGEVLVKDGRLVRADETDIAERGRRAAERVWELALRRGLGARA